VPLREIDSLFGFVERSTLYGGRVFAERELSDRDVFQLNNAGIGIRLSMSNHFVRRDEYERNLPLLQKYYRPCNSIIVTNDKLARWIRRDFPNYQIDASVIKNLKTQRKINEALKLYDSVVLPMRLNQNLDFLEKIEAKDRITLFANAGCALTCPSKLCYLSISRINKGKGGEFQCSQMIKDRELLGMVDFPLQPYIDRGFHRFKLLRARPGALTGY
jgi:collagenase-like PrtC family protease